MEELKLKKYQVVFVDEYNNWYLIGFFDNLRDAEPQLNVMLEGYTGYDDDDNRIQLQFGDDTDLGPLQEYAGSLSPVFDRIIDTDVGCIQVRGFVF